MAFWSRKHRRDGEARQRGGADAEAVAQITAGMTPYDVTERIGPPLDRMDMAELVGGSKLAERARRAKLPDSDFWLYMDVPEKGLETDIVFEHGVVSSVMSKPHGMPQRNSVVHGWAKELVEEHISRAEREHADGRLAERRAWRTLADDEAMEFVLCNPPQSSPPGTGEFRARRFGEVDVVVTLLDTTSTEAIRAAMEDGYTGELDGMLRSRGITPGRTDVAHWILCREDDEHTAVHLAYVAADEELPALMPWDLLSDEERRRAPVPAPVPSGLVGAGGDGQVEDGHQGDDDTDAADDPGDGV